MPDELSQHGRRNNGAARTAHDSRRRFDTLYLVTADDIAQHLQVKDTDDRIAAFRQGDIVSQGCLEPFITTGISLDEDIPSRMTLFDFIDDLRIKADIAV